MTVDELFDACERAWSGRDPAAFAALCTPAFHYEDPLTREPLEQPDALASHALRLWPAFPDAGLDATGARLSDGRFATAPAKLLGTHVPPSPAWPRPTARSSSRSSSTPSSPTAAGTARAFFDAYGAAVQLGIPCETPPSRCSFGLRTGR